MENLKSPNTSTSLILRIQSNDQDAWTRLEYVYKPLILYWCNNESISENDQEDIVQTVFQTVYRYVGDFIKYRDKASFRPWLRKITISRIADFRRNLEGVPTPLSETSLELIKQMLVSESPDPADEKEEETERQITIKRVFDLVKKEVERKTWEAFYRTAILGEDSVSVGKQLGMKSDNVRKAKSNVIKRIKDEFEDLL